MSRQTKLKFATALTALVTSLGTVAVTATAGTMDAGKGDTSKNTGGGWCC